MTPVNTIKQPTIPLEEQEVSARLQQPHLEEGYRFDLNTTLHSPDPSRVHALSDSLDTHIRTIESFNLGSITERHDIQSSMSPFQVFSEVKIQYPQIVLDALGELYREYNAAFTPLVEKNKEWNTDYQYCLSETGLPTNAFVQIDMNALPTGFLADTSSYSAAEVKEVLRRHIFEFENSLAMYQFLCKAFSAKDTASHFDRTFRQSLDELRTKHNKPIALLATTQEKYDAMLTSEFGVPIGTQLSSDDIRALSGFDDFFGPEELKEHVGNNTNCNYLLYVRSSDPVSKLKKPRTVVDNPLLQDANLRRIIKAHTLTFNIDNPQMSYDGQINDTKEYMPPMQMGHMAFGMEDILSPKAIECLSNGQSLDNVHLTDTLQSGLITYLISQGVEVDNVKLSDAVLHFKPMKNTYGCYGHIIGSLTDRKKRNELRKNMKERGAYIIQPQLQTPSVQNTYDEQVYSIIDRNFFAFINNASTFLGGFRSFMPRSSEENAKGRNHGSKHTVWAEVIK